MIMPWVEPAYAKINLALHVRSRRDDGYHELESLVAFLDKGDILTVSLADADRFIAEGVFANIIGDDARNLALRALKTARSQPESAEIKPIPPLSVHLDKLLPVAAGLGGGSADAGAMLRILNKQFGTGGEIRSLAEAAIVLGADVPACVLSQTLIMRGIGEKIELLNGDDSLDGIWAVLVNPNVAVPTGPVFKAWDGKDRGGLSAGPALEIALAGRNDLEAPAITLCPIISKVLAALSATHPILSRMSGSGATCFALYDDPDRAANAAAIIRDTTPDWWVMEGGLITCR